MVERADGISFQEELVFSLIQGRLKSFIESHPEPAIDYTALYTYLRWNRLVPFLLHSIKEEKAEWYFNQEFMELISGAYKSEILRSMKREAVLKMILSLLSEKNIQCAVLKGALFANSYYPLPALRPSYDIDLLIYPPDIYKAEEILLNAGFEKCYEVESAHTTGQLPHLPALQFKGFTVELHRDLFYAFDKQPVTIEEIFATLRKINLLGMQVHVLSPEICIYYLLNHIRKHITDGYTRLIWFLDIKLLLQKEKPEDLRPVLEKWISLKNGRRKEMEDLIYFTEQITGIEFYNSTGNSAVIAFYLSMCHNHREKEYLKTIRAIKKLDTPEQKIRYIAGRFFPSFAYVKFKYGIKRNFLVPFYYLAVYRDYFIKLYRVALGKKTVNKSGS